MKIVEMLISRGARVHTTNMGDDTPLHLAAAHGHKEVVQMVSLSLMMKLVLRQNIKLIIKS